MGSPTFVVDSLEGRIEGGRAGRLAKREKRNDIDQNPIMPPFGEDLDEAGVVERIKISLLNRHTVLHYSTGAFCLAKVFS